MKRKLMTATLCLCSLMLLGAIGGCSGDGAPIGTCPVECEKDFEECMSAGYWQLTTCESACPPWMFGDPLGHEACRTSCVNEARFAEDACLVMRQQCLNGCPPGSRSSADSDSVGVVDVQGQDERINPYWVPIGAEVELVAGTADVTEDATPLPDVCDEPGWADYRDDYFLPLPSDVEYVTFEYLTWPVVDTLTLEQLITPGGPWICIGEARRSLTQLERNLSVSLDLSEPEFDSGIYIIRAISYPDAPPADPGVLLPSYPVALPGGEVSFGHLMIIPYALEDICED